MSNNLSKKSKSIDKKVELAINYHSKGKLLEAEKLYKQLLANGNNDYRILFNYAVLCDSQNRLLESANLYRELLKLYPRNDKYYFNLSCILKKTNQLQESENLLRKSIALNPKNYSACNNLANILRDRGDYKEAINYIRNSLDIHPNTAVLYYTLSLLQFDINNLEDAEISARKAIEINENFALAFSHLAEILRRLHKLDEAKTFIDKAINILPKHGKSFLILGSILLDSGEIKKAESSLLHSLSLNKYLHTSYYLLSRLKELNNISKFRKELFSEVLLKECTQRDKINLLFARSNILHKEKRYSESAQCLLEANNLKLSISKSDCREMINTSLRLQLESSNLPSFDITRDDKPEAIFIVGMPRSGTTLLESILSLNNDIDDLGETNIFQQALNQFKKEQFNDEIISIEKIYYDLIFSKKGDVKSTTNKYLYNYQYAGIISQSIKNSKIIHCHRNPLDNILSIYRAHFIAGNTYSSSLVDCAYLYLDHEKTISKYLEQFNSKIYQLDYDKLVVNPEENIRNLISWLGWEWDDLYLSPESNSRIIYTASNVQARSPINAKSVGGWRKYQDLLKPAIQIITNTQKYRDLCS